LTCIVVLHYNCRNLDYLYCSLITYTWIALRSCYCSTRLFYLPPFYRHYLPAITLPPSTCCSVYLPTPPFLFTTVHLIPSICRPCITTYTPTTCSFTDVHTCYTTTTIFLFILDAKGTYLDFCSVICGTTIFCVSYSHYLYFSICYHVYLDSCYYYSRCDYHRVLPFC